MLRLSDEHWPRIREHFPEEHITEGRPGRKPIPAREVLEAALWRKLPRQGDSFKEELSAVCRALNRDGGTRPKVSCGRSSFYSCIHCALISHT